MKTCRIIWVQNEHGSMQGIELCYGVDPNDWSIFNLLASEYFRQRVKVNRGQKLFLPYGDRAQNILDRHSEAVKAFRKH